MLRLRVLTKKDWPLWREVRLAALAEAPHAFKARLADWHTGGEEQWRARLETPGTYNIVALLNGRAVGVARGVPSGNDTRELRSVWVHPAARGRGVADELVAEVEAWALCSGASALKLAVLPGNESAIAFYQRAGFAFTGELGGAVGDPSPDSTTREHIMVKAIR